MQNFTPENGCPVEEVVASQDITRLQNHVLFQERGEQLYGCFPNPGALALRKFSISILTTSNTEGGASRTMLGK